MCTYKKARTNRPIPSEIKTDTKHTMVHSRTVDSRSRMFVEADAGASTVKSARIGSASKRFSIMRDSMKLIAMGSLSLPFAASSEDGNRAASMLGKEERAGIILFCITCCCCSTFIISTQCAAATFFCPKRVITYLVL